MPALQAQGPEFNPQYKKKFKSILEGHVESGVQVGFGAGISFGCFEETKGIQGMEENHPLKGESITIQQLPQLSFPKSGTVEQCAPFQSDHDPNSVLPWGPSKSLTSSSSHLRCSNGWVSYLPSQSKPCLAFYS